MVSRRDQKAQRKKQVIISVFLSFLMVVSLAGVFIGSQAGPEPIEYNGYTFEVQDNILVGTINGHVYPFYSYPDQSELFPLPEGFLTTIQLADQVTVIYPPSDPNAAYIDVVRFDLATALPSVDFALTEPDERFLLPVLTCANASAEQPAILIQTHNETGFSGDEHCLILQGDLADFLFLRDAFFYRYLGVVQDG
jgi:hypothetical protein